MRSMLYVYALQRRGQNIKGPRFKMTWLLTRTYPMSETRVCYYNWTNESKTQKVTLVSYVKIIAVSFHIDLQ